jgi:hypothetical protein
MVDSPKILNTLQHSTCDEVQAAFVIRGPKTAFFKQPILQFQPYIGFVIRNSGSNIWRPCLPQITRETCIAFSNTPSVSPFILLRPKNSQCHCQCDKVIAMCLVSAFFSYAFTFKWWHIITFRRKRERDWEILRERERKGDKRKKKDDWNTFYEVLLFQNIFLFFSI